MAAMKVYIIGGLLLVLLSPLWMLTMQLPLDEGSLLTVLVRMRADEWGRWLGVLAVVLGLLQKYVAASPTTRIVAAVIFMFGSILLPLGTARGFGAEQEYIDPLYAAGAGLAATALLLNLIGVLRYRQGGSAGL